MKGLNFISVLFLLFFTFSALAQEDTVKQVIITHAGIEYIGQILGDDAREVLIETETLGKIYIPKATIKSITKLSIPAQIVNNEFRDTGPFTTRYAFTNNALPIKKGENYAMVNLFGPEVHFAVGQKLNIGVMATWVASPFVLASKYTFNTNDQKVNFSAGTLLGTSGYINTFESYGGVHWLSATLGDRMNNITLSGGYVYLQLGTHDVAKEGVYYNVEPELYSTPRPLYHGPVFSIAGIVRVGAKASLVFDSMIFTYDMDEYNEEFKQLTENTPFVEGTYSNTITKRTVTKSVLALMPGMRFQKTDRQAHQISLAGVSVFGGNELSFPFPMYSWFTRF